MEVVHSGIGMTPGSLARIEDAKGLRIEVWDGELWITQDGDRRDYFVKPGMSLLLGRNGLTLVYALRRSHLTLSAPVPAYYARRITLASRDGGTASVIYDRTHEAGGWFAGVGHRLTRFWTNAYALHSVPTTAVPTTAVL